MRYRDELLKGRQCVRVKRLRGIVVKLLQLVNQPFRQLRRRSAQAAGNVRRRAAAVGPEEADVRAPHDRAAEEHTGNRAGGVLHQFAFQTGPLRKEVLTAGGSEEKVKQGKKIITTAVIGVAIALGAYLIVTSVNFLISDTQFKIQ